MIELFEGVPGAGKSYHVLKTKILPWVRSGRRLYIYMDRFYLDRLALFEDRTLEDLSKQITLWTTEAEAREGLLTVEDCSAVVLDEVQTLFRSGEKLPRETLRWLETHRHHGIDIAATCQEYGQVTIGFIRLVEGTTAFERLDRFGFSNKYRGKVRGNPTEVNVIRPITGTYDSKIYSYYGSYSSGAVSESQRKGSVLRHPLVILGCVGFCAGVWWFGWGGSLSGAVGSAASSKPSGSSAAVGLPPPSLPVQSVVADVVSVVRVNPVRIQGGLTVWRDGKETWLWVSADGRLLTEAEIAGESGGQVQSRMVRGVRVLSGSGVLYGGIPAESTQARQSIVSYVPPVNPNVTEPAPAVFDSGRPNPFLTPPDSR